MLYAYQTHKIKWKSRWSLVFFHVTVRVASQGCGLAFGIHGFENTDVFLAYLILGAEGYFTLVSTGASYFFLFRVRSIKSKSLQCRSDLIDF